ncbi:MAG TPA: hypothetical protein VJO15_03675, partial [Dehalococcoidia bacterium]|nr:hypothetical protein [Dehalococcoidia bacterium]
MGIRLGIMVCENLHLEAVAAVEAEGLAEVEVLSFPNDCTSGRLPREAIARSIAEEGRGLFRIDLIASAGCAGPSSSASPVEGCRVLRLEQCHHLFVPRMVADAYQKDGAYLLTPGWLARWRHFIDEWGFDQETAGEFFKESAGRL